MKIFLAIRDIETRTGVPINRLKWLMSAKAPEGSFPEPDAQVGVEGRVWFGWLPETVDRWHALDEFENARK